MKKIPTTEMEQKTMRMKMIPDREDTSSRMGNHSAYGIFLDDHAYHEGMFSRNHSHNSSCISSVEFASSVVPFAAFDPKAVVDCYLMDSATCYLDLFGFVSTHEDRRFCVYHGQLP